MLGNKWKQSLVRHTPNNRRVIINLHRVREAPQTSQLICFQIQGSPRRLSSAENARDTLALALWKWPSEKGSDGLCSRGGWVGKEFGPELKDASASVSLSLV